MGLVKSGLDTTLGEVFTAFQKQKILTGKKEIVPNREIFLIFKIKNKNRPLPIFGKNRFGCPLVKFIAFIH